MLNRFKVKSVETEVSRLQLHPGANREVRMGRVRQLEKNMDLDALGRFAVWRQQSNMYVIDGQHRKLALEALGFSDYKVRCDVYEGMSFEQACEQFLKLNDGLSVSPFDKYDKGVKAGRMAETDSKRIVEKVGFRVGDQNGDGRITCVAAIVDTWKLDQGAALETALTVASRAWGHTAPAVEGHVVRGLGIVAARYNGEVDYPALIKKLSKYPGGPSNLVGQAKALREYSGGTVSKNVASIVVSLYNKGRRGGQVPAL